MPRGAYIDASALVKLFKLEPESAALRRELENYPVRLASELLSVEVRCVARRAGDYSLLAGAERALETINLMDMTSDIAGQAGATSFEPPLRALDAVHLATALDYTNEIEVLVAYDEELIRAARNCGLDVISPGIEATTS